MIKKEVTILILILGMVFAGLANSNNNQLAYAHNFTPNSLSTFITLVYRAQVELSLANGSFPLNVTMALDHAEDAAKLIDDAYYSDEEIVDDADFARKYNEALNARNSTIHALVIANIVDQILREYGKAFDIGYDLTNMSNMMRADMPDVTSYPAPPSGSANNIDIPTNSTNQNNELRVVNIADYQSAQKLLEKAYQIFRGSLSLLPLPSNNTDPSIMAKLEKSMKDLSYLVEIKAPAQELMTLVHGEIHPSLQLAYDLGLKQ
jgi:hypothetical protein